MRSFDHDLVESYHGHAARLRRSIGAGLGPAERVRNHEEGIGVARLECASPWRSSASGGVMLDQADPERGRGLPRALRPHVGTD